MEWKIIENEDFIIFKIIKNGHFIVWSELYSNINFNFIKSFIDLLSNCKFNEYYLEFNPVSYSTLNTRIFEFILIKTNNFPNANFNEFNKYNINSNSNEIRIFNNLSNTSVLIAPCYNNNFDINTYNHIGNYIKNYNIKQHTDLFYTVFSVYFNELKKHPNNFIWLSTHGKGVGWLHIRIDYIPKYISWISYKKIK